jgi:hypothetical protein
MRASGGRHRSPALKALYSIPELAELADVTRWQMTRMLTNAGVEFRKSGRVRYVTLVELEKKFRDVWDSIKDRISHYDLAD